MGFRPGAYATVWAVEPKTDTWTKVRLSVSMKDKNTGQYDQKFSGFVEFVGTATANKAKQLKERDRIRLGDIDVESRYKSETKETFYNFKCFSFEPVSSNQTQQSNGVNMTGVTVGPDGFMEIESNPYDGDISESNLPF